MKGLTLFGRLPCVLLMTIFVIGLTESRTISEDNFYPGSLAKRNSWWSKKSLDDNAVKLRDNRLSEDGCDCHTSLRIHKCYATHCVTGFLHCLREAISEQHYSICHEEHNLCLSKCYRLEEDNF
ncbi:uncharacterized protein LOC133184375 [Saccostrea echinata]|uniref:uncharacterized protein LOC133184375 n=1 Tax=Saccostrea echinata TaxID=191078 RepID=UPI002A7EC3D4|nr:uncharacterized protein LOC133184375 [Saccostrea echinata]